MPMSDPMTHPRSCAPRAAAVLAVSLTLAVQGAFAVLDPPAWRFAAVEDARLNGPAPNPSPARERAVRIASAERLARMFERLGYHLEAVESGIAVPAVELAGLPVDLDAVAPVDVRKALFIRTVLPIVLRANGEVLAERAEVETVLATLEAGGSADQAEPRLRRIAGRYGLPGISLDPDGLRRLLRRVDAVPVSMALAQAIAESGWGTSRFALAGNALFGQWTWNPVDGMLPTARADGRKHRVRAFATLTDSARAYVRNLNTHAAYAGFRHARAAARAAGGTLPAGEDLIRHLTRYSERGAVYVGEIRTLIRQNRLDRLERAALGEPGRYADALPPADEVADRAADG